MAIAYNLRKSCNIAYAAPQKTPSKTYIQKVYIRTRIKASTSLNILSLSIFSYKHATQSLMIMFYTIQEYHLLIGDYTMKYALIKTTLLALLSTPFIFADATTKSTTDTNNSTYPPSANQVVISSKGPDTSGLATLVFADFGIHEISTLKFSKNSFNISTIKAGDTIDIQDLSDTQLEIFGSNHSICSGSWSTTLGTASTFSVTSCTKVTDDTPSEPMIDNADYNNVIVVATAKADASGLATLTVSTTSAHEVTVLKLPKDSFDISTIQPNDSLTIDWTSDSEIQILFDYDTICTGAWGTKPELANVFTATKCVSL